MATFRNVEAGAHPKLFGMSRRKVEDILRSGLAKITSLEFPCTKATPPLTPQEQKLVKWHMSFFIVREAFTQKQIISELIDLLTREDVLEEGEREGFHSSGDYVAVYALSCMHGSTIVFKEGTARLRLGVSDGLLALYLIYRISGVDMMMEIVTTEAEASKWLPLDRPSERAPFEGPIEIGPDWKLSEII